MKRWTPFLVLFITALGGLSNAKADDDDYWRYRHHRWHDGDGDRDDWRHRHHHHHWRYGDEDHDYWRHRYHHHDHDGVVIQLP